MAPYIYITLPAYSVMAFLGGFCALVYTYFRINKFSVEFSVFIKLVLVSIIGGFFGGKILFVITQLPELAQNFSFSNLQHLIFHSGIVFYGGLFGVLLLIKKCVKHTQHNEPKLFNMFAPAIPLFHSFGRIGCLLAGCCYGKEIGGSVRLLGTIQIDRIPTQAIESIFEFLLFVILHLVEKTNKDINLLKVYLLSYACFRFAIEFFRDDELRGVFIGLSTAQWISLSIALYYVVNFMQRKRLKVLNNFEQSVENTEL